MCYNVICRLFFIYPTYNIEVKLCAFSSSEMTEAKKLFDTFFA